MLSGSNSSERLQNWRDIRNTQYTDAAHLILEFPYAERPKRFIDFYTPSSWPGAFEIVSEGYFCQSGLTIVMALSLHHAGFISGEGFTFLVISNNITGNTGLVLSHNGLVYNFAQGEITPYNEVLNNSTVYTVHEVKIKHLFG